MKKVYKPTSPGRRHRITIVNPEVNKTRRIKSLTVGKVSTGGRNYLGKITTRHRGGAHRNLRIINDESLFYSNAVVVDIHYDPNRSSNLALCATPNNTLFYAPAPENISKGVIIPSAFALENEIKLPQEGEIRQLSQFPVGKKLYNIDKKYGRSAGTTSVIKYKFPHKCLVKLPSGESKWFSSDVLATFGEASNINHHLRKLGKAGTKRHMGFRPTVRGKAMNAVDHKGKPYSKWGKLVKGVKTRKHVSK